jgi:predicted P-loop ATPase
MLDPNTVNGVPAVTDTSAHTHPAPAPVVTPEPVDTTSCSGSNRADREAALRGWLHSHFDLTLTSSPDPKQTLIDNFRRQLRFLGLADGERYEVQIIGPDMKDPNRRFDEQVSRFAYTASRKGGLQLLYDGENDYGYQGLYIIPQIVNPAALSKAAPDAWHIPAKGVGTDAKDIQAFLDSYADFDTIREGGAKKVSATHEELWVSCDRGIQFYCDAADILGSDGALGFMFSGNGSQVHVALDRLPHTSEVQALRADLVHVTTILYGDERVAGDDTVCNPNRLCPAAGTWKRKGFNDVQLGRLHRLTGFYCADRVERLGLERFRYLVEALRARLTTEQREALAKKTKIGGHGSMAGAGNGARLAPASSRSPAGAKRTGPSPYEVANAVPIADVYQALGQDRNHPRCPGCGADDTTGFLDEKLGVQSLKCFHATCGARSWKNIDLVVVLALGKSIDDADARREAVNWIAERFPRYGIPQLKKSKAALKADVDARIAECPTYLEGLVGDCSLISTNEELRHVVEMVQTRDAAPKAMLLKALASNTRVSKRDLVALTKSETEASEPADYTDAEWPTPLHRSKKGAILSTFSNAVTVLAHDARWRQRLAWCDFTNRVVLLSTPPWPAESVGMVEFIPGCPWEESDDHRLVDYLERHYGISVSPRQAYNAALLTAGKRRVHPVRDYLRSLTWDGKPRLDTWLTTYLGVRNEPYTRLVGPWTLMQAVKRIFEPGCKADYVLVLEGAQGIKKSSAIRALCPEPTWVSDTMFVIGTKDAMVALRGRWFIELPEAMSLLRAEHATSKAWFTSPCDDYRPPYGAHNVQVERQCVFFATINPEGGYLRDPTGNRRYWPVACGEVGPIGLVGIAADRDQLWAEAVARYLKGERCYPELSDEHVLLGGEQEERGEQDPWHEEIEKELACLNEVTIAYVLWHVLSIETAKQEPRLQSRVVKILTSLGWRLRGVSKVVEGEKRKSVRIYARRQPIPNAVPFTPGMTSHDAITLRARLGANGNGNGIGVNVDDEELSDVLANL